LCVSAGPDLRGGRGAAVVNGGGGGDGESTGIDFLILFGSNLIYIIQWPSLCKFVFAYHNILFIYFMVIDWVSANYSVRIPSQATRCH
jgi:hypothetical protein